jgi:uncharacterized protein (TIGR02147 family)
MMKPIFEYRDYREYMRDFYEERKRCSAFTWREFAKLAGFSSSGYLKLVCDGKTRLSLAGIPQVASAMELAGSHAEYFRLMVVFNDAKKTEEKQAALEQMMSVAAENKVDVLDVNSFAYFSSWLHPVLRELAPIMPNARPLEFAQALIPPVPAADVRYSLELQEKLGLLKKDKHGRYRQVNKGVSSSREVKSVAVKNMQKQFARLAADALDECSLEERHISGLTIGISQRAYERIALELEAFRRKVAAIVSADAEYDRVYRLNLQLFPLNRKKEK